MMRLQPGLLATLLVCAVACGDDDGGNGLPADAPTAVDARAADGADPGDGAADDGALPDGDVPDGAAGGDAAMSCMGSCTCGPAQICSFDCAPGDNCQPTCDTGSTCSVNCSPGEDCDGTCEPGATCTMNCVGDCRLTCEPGSTCTASCAEAGTCELVCELGAICACTPGAGTCECNGDGCP
jgi:hypothetical protein